MTDARDRTGTEPVNPNEPMDPSQPTPTDPTTGDGNQDGSPETER